MRCRAWTLLASPGVRIHVLHGQYGRANAAVARRGDRKYPPARRDGSSPLADVRSYTSAARTLAKILRKPQEIAVGVLDDELPVAHLDLIPPVPLLLQLKEHRRAGRPHPGKERLHIRARDLEVDAAAVRALQVAR